VTPPTRILRYGRQFSDTCIRRGGPPCPPAWSWCMVSMWCGRAPPPLALPRRAVEGKPRGCVGPLARIRFTRSCTGIEVSSDCGEHRHGFVDLLLGQLEVFEGAGMEGIVRRQVEVTVAAQVEEDDLLFA
jgi:hypothetical protein